MSFFPKRLLSLLDKRKRENNFRTLSLPDNNLVDFSSNDYLGFSKSVELKKLIESYLKEYKIQQEGSTGSRLITGNSRIHTDCEKQIATFHHAEKALLFNSGYDANVGLISSLPQRGDVVLYDELCHASIIDGVRLSFANSFKFRHNNIIHLKELLEKNKGAETIYVVTESVFSMDGDCALLKEIVSQCKKYKAYLIVDEAHAIGVFGEQGRGLCNELGIEQDCFARIYTFGKAMGAHGAAVVGNENLYNYLLNFSRSIIYTTVLPPASIALIMASYKLLQNTNQTKKLRDIICLFNELTTSFQNKINSTSAIHCFLIAGNKNVINTSKQLISKGLDIRAIKSPTVKIGAERLRICLHATNTKQELAFLAKSLKQAFDK
ncbi:MAG: aminotransferase class I/II-fold pyridoxal phosphate-dependent enzyme [Bacteroidia bacterium]